MRPNGSNAGSAAGREEAERSLLAEAESLAYMVSERRGVHSKSETYLAGYVGRVPAISALDFYRLAKAAGQLEAALGIEAHTLFEPAKRHEEACAATGDLSVGCL